MYAKNGAGLTTITEDVTFCQKVEALGCPIWIDPSISCGHVSAQVVDENWFNRSMIEKAMLEQQLAGQVKPVETTNNGLVFDAR